MNRLSHRPFYPWAVIFLCALFLLYKYVLQVSPSVMTTELMGHFHIDGAGLGNLAATFFYTYLVAQLFVGPLLDQYSPRWLTAGAILLCAGGVLFFSQAQNLLGAAVARSCIGVGAAFATVAYMKMTITWFKPQQFAFVGGLLATAAMVGSILGQTPMAWMVAKWGWRDSLFYCGIFGIILAIFFVVVVRDRAVRSRGNQTAYANAVSSSYPDGDGVSTNKLTWQDFAAVLTKRYNWLLMLYSGLAFCPLAVLGGLWGNPFLETTYHVDAEMAASMSSLMFLGLAAGAPILGALSGRWKRLYDVMALGLIVAVVSLLLALYWPFSSFAVPVVGLALFAFGFGTGAFMLSFAVSKELNPIVLMATASAFLNTGDGILGSISEPFIGKILDFGWGGEFVNGARLFSVHDYHIALAVLPLYLILALFALRGIKKEIIEKIDKK